ncbi:MAG: YdcF family protein [Pseudomonadales bacterium]
MDFFYTLSKIFWFVASPDNFLILLTLISAILIACKSKWGLRLLSVNVFILITILFLPVGDLLLRPLEARFAKPVQLPEKVEGIIVLGGAERASLATQWQQAQFSSAAERMMALPALAARYPDAKLIFTGGSGSLIYGSDVAAPELKQWFVEQGLGERVLWERKSRNTYENALYSQALLGGVPQGQWLLVTSASHIPRSMGIFRLQGWDVLPYPVDYNSMTADALRLDPKYWQHVRDLGFALKEWIGLVVYYYTGKTDQLFPAPVESGDGV